jgi:hypothetical protein
MDCQDTSRSGLFPDHLRNDGRDGQSGTELPCTLGCRHLNLLIAFDFNLHTLLLVSLKVQGPCGSRKGWMLDGFWKKTWRHNLLYWLRKFSPNFNLGRGKDW